MGPRLRNDLVALPRDNLTMPNAVVGLGAFSS